MPVEIHRTQSAAGELGLVELQGKLQFEDVAEGATKARVGTFSRVNETQGKVAIKTGRYLIEVMTNDGLFTPDAKRTLREGETKKLARPLAVLQKRPRNKKYTYCVVGILKQKVIFNSRPNPMVEAE